MASVLYTPDCEAYIVSCDVDANDGVGLTRFSSNVKNAIRFADAKDAMAYWMKVSTVRPLRPDGKPNRPLSAYTVEVRTVADDAPRMPSRASTDNGGHDDIH